MFEVGADECVAQSTILRGLYGDRRIFFFLRQNLPQALLKGAFEDRSDFSLENVDFHVFLFISI